MKDMHNPNYFPPTAFKDSDRYGQEWENEHHGIDLLTVVAKEIFIQTILEAESVDDARLMASDSFDQAELFLKEREKRLK